VAPAATLMSTRNLLNLVLLVIAGTLAAVIALRPGTRQADTPQPVTGIDPQTITRIELTRSKGDALKFIRTDGHWQIDTTPALPADDFQVQTVLALLTADVVRKYAAASLDLAQVGLDPPQTIASYDHTRLELGTTDALDGLRYVRLGDTVYLVADRFAHLLNAGVSNFLQRGLLPEGVTITGLQLPGLALNQTDGVHWQLHPDDPAASADNIHALLNNWLHASALYVTRGDASGARESIQIRLREQQQPLEFALVARTPELVLARPDRGMQYHFPAETAAELLAIPKSAPVAPASR
jgi:Domain of unknown function (DUF4340)